MNNQREKTIPNTPQDYVDLYEKCWSNSPDQRPTLSKILKQLTKLVNHISNINAIIVNDDHYTITFVDLDKSSNLKEVRRHLSKEKDLMLGRQNVYFYNRRMEKISRDHENNYTLEDILMPDGSDFSFYIESDLSKPSFPKIVQLLSLDRGRIFDNRSIKTASKQAGIVKDPKEKDINMQKEYINTGEGKKIYYQIGNIRLLQRELQVSEEYIKAIKAALDDNKSVEEQREALNKVGKEYGYFW
ncbi:2417_t:CDS:2 [Racocetra fulgida]|uniref:2417_t:CDS:1 n=1 Tax=Racocetra fulgida TaxID=60492 RepID=A0A9N9DUW5_9GLOM|nr:2417_t:CDS:2 [Racocetra fulgida]